MAQLQLDLQVERLKLRDALRSQAEAEQKVASTAVELIALNGGAQDMAVQLATSREAQSHSAEALQVMETSARASELRCRDSQARVEDLQAQVVRLIDERDHLGTQVVQLSERLVSTTSDVRRLESQILTSNHSGALQGDQRALTESVAAARTSTSEKKLDQALPRGACVDCDSLKVEVKKLEGDVMSLSQSAATLRLDLSDRGGIPQIYTHRRVVSELLFIVTIARLAKAKAALKEDKAGLNVALEVCDRIVRCPTHIDLADMPRINLGEAARTSHVET